MKRLAYLFVIFIFIIAACQTQKGLNMTGTLKGAGNLEGMFEEVMMSQVLAIQKVSFDVNGSFKMSIPDGAKAGIYRLRVGQRQLNFVFSGEEKNVNVEADLATLTSTEYKVSGSADTEKYLSVLSDVKAGKMQATNVQKVIEDAKNPLLSMILALQVEDFAKPEYVDLHKKIAKKLSDAYPGSPYSKDYDKMMTEFQNSVAMQAAGATTIAVGQPAPEISLPDPNGTIYKLSDLKGKVVLLDFWASWCGPCRRANPSVVSAYNRYKNKGFVVYNVSLDRDKQKWVDAIKQDGLSWKYHVSDLQFWNSQAARLYRVNAIPQQFLIDKQGKIAAISQSGMSLERELERMLN
jgi:thiol-disulfide isomerase/thioredoxin